MVSLMHVMFLLEVEPENKPMVEKRRFLSAAWRIFFIPSQKIGNKIGWQNLATSRRHTEKLVTIVLLFFVTENGPQNGPWDCKKGFSD